MGWDRRMAGCRGKAEWCYRWFAFITGVFVFLFSFISKFSSLSPSFFSSQFFSFFFLSIFILLSLLFYYTFPLRFFFCTFSFLTVSMSLSVSLSLSRSVSFTHALQVILQKRPSRSIIPAKYPTCTISAARAPFHRPGEYEYFNRPKENTGTKLKQLMIP